MAKVTVEQVWPKFLEYIEREKEANTLRVYEMGAREFVAEYGSREIGSISEAEVKWFAKNPNITASMQDKRTSAVKALFKFAVANRYIKDVPYRSLMRGPLVRRTRVSTEEEESLIREEANPEFRYIFDALQISAAFERDLCNANIEDISHTHEGRAIVIRDSKSRREKKRIPTGKRLGAVVDQAIDGRTRGPIFLSPQGRRWMVENLSRTFTRLKKRLDLDPQLTLISVRKRRIRELVNKHGINKTAELLTMRKNTLVAFLDKRTAAISELAKMQD